MNWMKRINPNKSLKTQLTAAFMLLSLLTLILGYFLIYTVMLNILQERSEQSVLRQFQQAEYSIMQLRGEFEKLSRTIIIDPEVQKILAEENKLPEVERINLSVSVMNQFSRLLLDNPFLESIYLYFETGKVIEVSGGKGSITEQRHFFETEPYALAKELFPRLIWLGARKSLDYSVFPLNTEEERLPQLISAVRGIKAANLKEQAGTLILNVNEKVLAGIYSSLYDSPSNRVSIVDKAGTIISGDSPGLLGTKIQVYDSIPADSLYGSLSLRLNGAKKQVVFYRLGDTGWMMVKEIPFAEFLRDIYFLRYVILVLLTVALTFSFGFSVYLIRKITRPVQELSKAMIGLEKGELGQMVERLPENELGKLGRLFNRMSFGIKQLVEQKERAEQEKSRQEMIALQAQINPHFLYNTLNTIKAMASMVQAHSVADSITALGGMLRAMFKESPMCLLSEEVEFTRHYARIMNYRYGDRIRLDIRLPDSLQTCEVLRFMFQPIVENAFIHGFVGGYYVGKITITAKEHGEDLYFTVTDTGKGMDAEQLERLRDSLRPDADEPGTVKPGIGLHNIHQRLKLHFGEKYGVAIESEAGGGTSLTASMPKVQKS